MSESDGGPGRREVAHRLFAAEFDDADFEYSESDEERAPNYVVTPTGARVNRLFVVGVLTEVEPVSEGVLRARVVDPTGAFVCYAGQYQPDERAFLERADSPAFVALTGKARTFQPDDADVVYTSVRPEAVNEVDASTRDRWTLDAAEATLDRVRTITGALALDQRGDALREVLEANDVDPALASGVPIAIEHYGTSEAYLASLAEVALDATRLVAGEVDEIEASTLSPDATVDRIPPVEPRRFEVPEDLSLPPETVEEAEPDLADEAAEEAGPDAGAEPAEAAEPETAGKPDTAAGEAPSEGDSEPPSDGDSESPSDGDSEPPTDGDSEPPAGEDSQPPEATPKVEATGVEDVGGAAQTAPSEGGEEDSAAGEDVGDLEPSEYDLDEAERAEIEAEYGTDFQSGTEVDEPGEADIETPEPEPSTAGEAAEPEPTTAGEVAEPEPSAAGEVAEPEPTAAGEAAERGPNSEDEGEAEVDEDLETDAGGEVPADADLEDVAVEVMAELDDGSGAPRDAVVEAVVDRTGADEAAVEDAIQSALMDGRCYEPDDDSLQAI